MSAESERKPTHYVPALASVPRRQPALQRANQLLIAASKQGFDWPNPDLVAGKIDEELAEAKEAVAKLSGSAVTDAEREHAKEEIGDLLSAVANLARYHGFNPEECLQATNDKFVARYSGMEKALHAQGRSTKEASLKEMIQLWNAQKDVKLLDRP